MMDTKRPFEIGARIFHPAHGVMTVVAVTREMPRSLIDPSPIGGVRAAIVGKNEPRTEVAASLDGGEVGVAPVVMTKGDEDVYVLEPSGKNHQVMVRVSEAVAWGARDLPSGETAKAALDALQKDVTVDANKPWAERYPTYMQRRQALVSSAEALRELCQIRGLREPTFGEKRMIDELVNGMTDELSLATNRSKDDVQAELLRLCSEQERMGKAKRPH